MSRSFKTIGVIKDRGLRRSEYNKRFRRINKQQINEFKDPKQMHEVVNQYDVCDFKFFWLNSKEFYLMNENKESIKQFKKRKLKYFSK
jgi:hypothetical protein